jgi:DNA (cytosine-5)-methyltransferase 1
MLKTSGSFFTGGALFDVGAEVAGYNTIWGIEKDDKIASVARLNGFPVRTADVLTLDLTTLERPDHFHASPPCPNFSVANNKKGETELDIAMADAVCRALAYFCSDTFTLENVVGYRKSESFKRITKKLTDLGYWWDATNLNSADFGVPQTRNRLWIRASRGLLRGYPHPEPWKGWYQAIEDLIPSLPDSEFAPWQLERLPEEYRNFVIGNGTYSSAVDADQPIQAITANSNQAHIRAVVSDVQGENSKGYKEPEEPISTITGSHTAGKYRALIVGDQKGQMAHSERRAFTVRAQGKGGTSPRAFVVPGGNASSFSVREHNEQARCVESINRTGNNPRAFVFDNGNTNRNGEFLRGEDEPVHTVIVRQDQTPLRAFVLDGQSNEGERITVRNEEEPIFTQSASASRQPARACMGGRVVKLDIRCLGRFQTVPDWYKGLTVKINGNGVPCLMAQKVLETL